MTRFYNIFSLVIILLITSLTSKSQQHAGSIESFTILPQYLNSDGKVVLSTGNTTTVKYKVTFARQLESVYPVNIFKPFNMAVALSVGSSSGGQIHLFNQFTKFTGSDFPKDKVFLDKEFTAIIDHSKLTANIPLTLAYVLNDVTSPIYGYQFKFYHFVFNTTSPPVPPVHPNGTILINSWISYDAQSHKLAPEGQIAFTPTHGYVEAKAFRAWGIDFHPPDAVPIYQFVGTYRNGNKYTFSFLYSPDSKADPFWSPGQIVFYAYRTQVPGSVPVYGYTAASGRNHYFSIYDETDPYWHNKYLAFYALPLN